MRNSILYTVSRLVFIAIFALALVLLPFFRIGRIISFPFLQLGQSMLLVALMMGIVCLFAVFLTLKVKAWFIHIKDLDFLMFLIFSWAVINGFVFQEAWVQSYRWFDLIGMVIFYVGLRILNMGENHLLLLIFLVFVGLAQLVYGQLQLYGVYASLHSGFPLTGSFFNPGPYSGYLAAVFPAALGIYLFFDKLLKDKSGQRQSIVKYLSLGACGMIFLVLPAAQSRASWLAVLVSAVFLLYHRYHRDHLVGLIDRPVKKYILVFFSVFVMILLLASIYLLKKNSADGRLLIWKASWGMIKQRPWVGLGFDRFKAGYMEAQAAYFEANSDDSSAYLADNVVYAFNEGLQVLAEQGIIGLLLVSLLVFFLFWTNRGNPGPSLRISQGGIISILVFGMFSYPSHILPIKLCAVLYLAIAADESAFFLYRKIKRPNSLIICGLSLFLLSIAAFSGVKLNRLYQASRDWKEALRLYNLGDNGTAIEKYRNAYPYFDKEGDFLTNYGKALSLQGLHKEALMTLEHAKYFAGNTIIQTALGDSYKALGLFKEAEEAYKLAVDMLPDRFYAHYLLAKLYEVTGENNKLIPLAKYLIEKEPKVPSPAVEEIKMEMMKILDKLGKEISNVRDGTSG